MRRGTIILILQRILAFCDFLFGVQINNLIGNLYLTKELFKKCIKTYKSLENIVNVSTSLSGTHRNGGLFCLALCREHVGGSEAR